MSKFTIVSSVYNEYELLRQFVESIIHNVDPESYEKVIIVDDFSIPSGKLRKYEDYINANLEKFEIINFNEYRRARYYKRGFSSTEIYSSNKESMGVVCAYQMALEKVTTDYVILCDTDCVFLKKSKDLLTMLEILFDKFPDSMAISQLVGHSSDDLFESGLVGMKNMPNENGGAGGPSPMFSAFRISAWTEHHLAPIASTPGIRRGNGFIDFFLSVIGAGLKVFNFPIYSGDFVFHLGGGTARRVNKEKEHGFGHLKGCTYKYGPTADGTVYDFYTGAHKIEMDPKEFVKYLQKKYSIPLDELAAPFDEKMLLKYDLNPKREVEFRPVHPEVKARLDLIASGETKGNVNRELWDSYTYGTPSGIDWPGGIHVPRKLNGEN